MKVFTYLETMVGFLLMFLCGIGVGFGLTSTYYESVHSQKTEQTFCEYEDPMGIDYGVNYTGEHDE